MSADPTLGSQSQCHPFFCVLEESRGWVYMVSLIESLI